MRPQWQNQLPHPIAFVLSGGVNLGAVQVGMLRALSKAGIYPDMVVGTSVDALNGVAIAHHGLAHAVEILETVWLNLQRQDIFPGGLWTQALQLLRTRHSIYSNRELAALIKRVCRVEHFEELSIPFGVVATEYDSHRGACFTRGHLLPALLASTALPLLYPPVTINNTRYVDGGIVSNVPLWPAVGMGAGSLVVLDSGNTCQRPESTNNMGKILFTLFGAAVRQRVLIEAPIVAQQLPVLYLPTPCPLEAGLLDFTQTHRLIEETAQVISDFLAEAAPPTIGAMTGAPYFYDEERRDGRIMALAA